MAKDAATAEEKSLLLATLPSTSTAATQLPLSSSSFDNSNTGNQDDCSYEKSEESRATLVLLRNAYTERKFDTVNEIIEVMVSKSLVTGLKKIHTACGYGFVELVERYLVEDKMDANSECSFNDLYAITPLHFCAGIGPDAITTERYKCVELLVKHGANVNHLTSRQDTPLHWATKLADLKVCESLVNNGVDINKINMDNCTCAHGAAFYKNIDVLEMLVDKKIDVNVKDISGKNILHLLCKDSLDENTPSGSIINEAASQAEKDAELAAKSKQLIKLVNRLVDELHMDVNEKDANEFTPFMYACEHDNLELIQTLIDHKADIEYTSSEGINGMLLAIVNSCVKVAVKLIEAGFNVKTSGLTLNCSYITDAAYLNDIEILRVLIDAGCDINETKEDENGVILNPLWAACERSNITIVDTLLKRGANTVIRPDLNMTALHCTAMAQYESLAIAKLLVEYKCPVNLKSTQAGETPLFLAINSGYAELVEYFLSLGVDPNDSSPVSRTCFQQAIFRGHKDIIVLLLDKGAYRLVDDDLNDLSLYIMDLYQDNDVEMISYFINAKLISREKVLECIENYHKWQTKQIVEQQLHNNEQDAEYSSSPVVVAGTSAEHDERDRLATPNDLRIDFDAASRMIYPNTVEELEIYLTSKMHLHEPSHLSDDE